MHKDRVGAYFRPSMRSNPFTVFEGIDGSGKSTQIRLLEEYLTARGHRVWRTAEPSDGPAGKLIRQVFSGAYPADDRVVAGLFVADRLESCGVDKNHRGREKASDHAPMWVRLRPES